MGTFFKPHTLRSAAAGPKGAVLANAGHSEDPPGQTRRPAVSLASVRHIVQERPLREADINSSTTDGE
jgi:hypothetical protein